MNRQGLYTGSEPPPQQQVQQLRERRAAEGVGGRAQAYQSGDRRILRGGRGLNGTDEVTKKTPIPKCRLYFCFCLGWCNIL
jgi:hypothetical protein